MARIEVKSVQSGIPSAWVDIDNTTDANISSIRSELSRLISVEKQISDAVAKAFVFAINCCPLANPSDIWQHLIYRNFLDLGKSDQQWKRISGFALERAFVSIYDARLAGYGLRIRILEKKEAVKVLKAMGILGTVEVSKIDLFIEGNTGSDWVVIGSGHAKASIAERIQDDVPASTEFMKLDFVSVLLTMDSKSYPPPHGNGINYGELGGRSIGIVKDRQKRAYIEEYGQFDGLFSFNLRTPASPVKTTSGKKIYTLSLSDPQPDVLVTYLVQRWASIRTRLS